MTSYESTLRALVDEHGLSPDDYVITEDEGPATILVVNGRLELNRTFARALSKEMDEKPKATFTIHVPPPVPPEFTVPSRNKSKKRNRQWWLDR